MNNPIKIEFIALSGEPVILTINPETEAAAIHAAGIARLVWGITSTRNDHPERSLVLVQIDAAIHTNPLVLAAASVEPDTATAWQWQSMAHDETPALYAQRMLAENIARVAPPVQEPAPPDLDQNQAQSLVAWVWDRLVAGETALAYLERHARKMKAHGRIWQCILEPTWLTIRQATELLNRHGSGVSQRTVKRRQQEGSLVSPPYPHPQDAAMVALHSVLEYGRSLNLDL